MGLLSSIYTNLGVSEAERKNIVSEQHVYGEVGIAYNANNEDGHREVWPRVLGMNAREACRQYMVDSTIYAIVNRKAAMLASCPQLLLKENTRTKEVQPLTTGYVPATLANPNPNMTYTELFMRFVMWKEITGRAYMYWQINPLNGKLVLDLLEPFYLTIITDPETKIKDYVYRVGGRVVYLNPAQVIAWEAFNPLDYFYGLTPQVPVQTDVKMSRYSREWMAAQMMRGNMRGGVISTATRNDDEELSKIKREWQQRGPTASRFLTIPSTITFVPFSEGNGDLGFNAATGESFGQVCIAYGLHPGLFDKSRENRPEAIIDIESFVWRNCLSTEMRIYCEKLTNLFVKPIAGSNALIVPDLDSVEPLNTNRLDKMKTASIELMMGTMTPNEYRALHGKPPYDGELTEFGETPIPVYQAKYGGKPLDPNQNTGSEGGRESTVTPDRSGKKSLPADFLDMVLSEPDNVYALESFLADN